MKPRENGDCSISILCNNLCDPLIDARDSPYIAYPRDVMRMMTGEHGLAYHVQSDGKEILFDTGGMQQTFMHNIRAVQPNISKLDTIVLSHGHHDHVGGVVPLLKARKGGTDSHVDIICHPHATRQRYSIVKKDKIIEPLDADRLLKEMAIKTHAGLSHDALVANGARCNLAKDATVLFSSKDTGIRVLCSGEIPRVHEKRFYPESYLIEEQGTLVKDLFLDDQCLIVEKTGQYLFILLGCCHAGLENTVERVKAISTLPIKAIIGGFHLSGVDQATINEKVAFLEELARSSAGKPGPERLILRPTHCSGEDFYLALRNQNQRTHLLDVERLPVGTRIYLG